MDFSAFEGTTSYNRVSRNRNPRPPVPTWADAAKKVLERYDHALPQKKILEIIQDENLKPCGRGSMPLACLNAMLNSNCKGEDAMFYRAPGQAACFGLKRDKNKDPPGTQGLSESKSVTRSPAASPKQTSNSATASPNPTQKPKETVRNAALRSARLKVNMQRSRNQAMPGAPGAALVAMPPRKPGAALCVMPPKKRPKLDAVKEDDARKDSKDSARLTNADAVMPTSQSTASASWTSGGNKASQSPIEANKDEREIKLQQQQQRLQRHKQHQQQLAERSRQQQQQLRMVHEQKRGIPFGSKPPQVPREQKDIDEIVKQIKREQEEQMQKESLRQQRRVMQTKLNQNRQINRSKTAPPPTDPPPNVPPENKIIVRKPPPVTGFLEVKLKKLKRMSMVEQIKKAKEGKIDLQSPESLFATISLKSFLNNEMFKQLPAAYQYQLLMLLPDVDRVKDKDSIVRMLPNALTNEFFTKACLEWQDKLLEGEFNVDVIQRVKQEEGKVITLDPWKEKFFEPTWGKSSLQDPIADANETSKIAPPELIKKERESSWSAFLKFSENTASEYIEEFKSIQKTLRHKAEAEAVRRNLKRKQLLLKSPTAQKKRADSIGKERSRASLKRAYLMQKKIHLEKQLAETNARLTDTSQPLSPGTQKRLMTSKADITTSLRKLLESSKDVKRSLDTNSLPGESLTSKFIGKPTNIANPVRVGPSDEELLRQMKRKSKSKKPKLNRESTDENFRGGERVLEEYEKFGLIKKGSGRVNLFDGKKHHSKKHRKNKHKKKKHSRPADGSADAHRHSSKIIKGPSVYVKNTTVPCPCKLAPMLICSGCGSFCHSDCINADKLCTLCVPA